jgi:flagellar basal body-associated protein FliL
MASDLDSVALAQDPEPAEGRSRWEKLGIVAAVSALAGGLAAAWWYRKTLSKLQEAGERQDDPQIRILGDDTEAE